MKTISYSHIGTRNNNEDSLGASTNTFIVCDGMGGHTSGEVASKFVVDEVLQLVSELQTEITVDAIDTILETVQVNLNKKLETQPELLKMGTTFTGVFFAKEAVYVAHIGDSRVYLVRPPEKKIWHTWDHSLVGGLMKSGEITREKGRLHPMSNRISKAITANDKGKTVRADIVKLDAIKKGDLFFLCSDGVNEAWKEHELMALLCNTDLISEEKLKKIETQCAQDSRDNNTAILLEIEKKDVLLNDTNKEIEWLPLASFEKDYEEYLINKKKEEEEDVLFVDSIQEKEQATDVNTALNEVNNKEKKQKGSRLLYFIVFSIVMMLLSVFLINSYLQSKSSPDKRPVKIINNK
jgi:serine/threonine protein phosphatase PrpC